MLMGGYEGGEVAAGRVQVAEAAREPWTLDLQS